MKVHNQNDPGDNPNYKFTEDKSPSNSSKAVNDVGGSKGGGSEKVNETVNNPQKGGMRKNPWGSDGKC